MSYRLEGVGFGFGVTGKLGWCMGGGVSNALMFGGGMGGGGVLVGRNLVMQR